MRTSLRCEYILHEEPQRHSICLSAPWSRPCSGSEIPMTTLLRRFQNVFAPYGVTPREFFSLMHMCRWHIAEPGTILVHNGDILDRVLLLHSGVAQAWETDATGRRRLRYLYAGKEPLMDQGAKATKSKSRSLEEGSIASVPVLERRNSGGEVELRSIIGGSALINSGLCGRVSV